MAVAARRRWAKGLAAVAVPAVVAAALSAPSAASAASRPLSVEWMKGYAAPGTPARYDRVGVLKVGPSSAKNVLVLEPGTSAGSAYFVPLARWIVAKAKGWQVWAVERRENLLEDQSELDLAKEGKATAAQLYDYYLGYLKDPTITDHFHPVATASVAFAKQWGMQVAVEDLRDVIAAAHRLGGKVVLGGHSLGGSVVTAYATWDFSGKPGADGLAGLLYIDGGSWATAETAQQAAATLATLDKSTTSPWLSFGGIPAPYAGIFEATGAVAALKFPDQPSLVEASGLLPAAVVPPVPVTNLGLYGYALNAATSPKTLLAAQAHLGKGLSSTGPPYGWDGAGALTPITRFATMFSGMGIEGVTGTEWYFPQRLTDDTGAVDDGNANPADQVLDVDATMGHQLPKSLRIYAFATVLGGEKVLQAAKTLAAQSKIPASHLTLVNQDTTYSHNDPAGAYPNNAFFAHLVPFLGQVGGSG
jgi:pimeloyl-ACP methyl ester carboxylesterase